MELHQLRYVLAVVEQGSFTAAAAAVRVHQSGVSTQVQKLERELGVTIFDRSARRVTLTPEGERVVAQARAAVAAVDEVAETANALRGLVIGSLRVGTVTGFAWGPLFDALADIHAQHPGVDIRVQEGESDDLISQVRSGALDVAFAAWSGDSPDGLEVDVVFDDVLVAVVARDHPWAARTRVRLAELARADLIALPVGTGARSALDRALSRVGALRAPRWEVASPTYVAALASRGLGVGIVSSTTALGWDELVTLRIADDEWGSKLGVLHRPAPMLAARAFLDRLDAARSGSSRSITPAAPH
ncbi:LysR substrate-binding domain-containing protein [Gryllotalpicola daejeonensis]|uniref:LysR substrate-binding domain-containing protein n=1 Tax=Gryllotalpicola daejeonensis TaxID=993087 RepID=A0ABP7ZMD6_9MICO